MENNIFEGAKFGDKFVTRDGRKSVVVDIREHYLTLFIERSHTEKSKIWGEYDYLKYLNGIAEPENFNKLDIVSRYQEPIDEDKLDELAQKCTPKTWAENAYDEDFILGFKAGYRKAKEG